MQIPKIDFQPYIQIALRRKWWIIVPFILCLAGGGGYIATSPKMYRASTLILVEAQRVPQQYVQSTITESLQSRLQTISQQVNSRTNLERVIKNHNLFPENDKPEKGVLAKIKQKLFRLIGREVQADQSKGPSMLGMVKNVRDKINISLKGRNQAFEIAFEWRDPQKAADVTNALASQFIEQNLRVREEMAMGTTSFLDSEVDRIRRQLEQKERALEKFKREHMGMLPEQLNSNLSTLNQLREELNTLQKRVEMEKQQAMMLRNQMSMNQDFSMPSEPLLSESDMGSGQGPEVSRLQDQLDQLLTKYTERHPDVVSLKKRIEKLQQQQESQEANATGPAEEEMAMPSFSPQDMIKPQLDQIQARIRDYEKQIQETRAEIQKYKERVEKTSEVELELKDLQRDYETVRERYQNLLAKKLNAQMAEELEKRQKGEQFRVVDPAIAPDKPFKPDINKILLMSLVLGLGMGGGLAYVRETIDPAFYTPEEVESYLNTKVEVSLPFVDHKGNKSRWRKGKDL
jgi:polysaccharide chain length determinant protein (PEP-CTERM system associated)